MNFGIRNFVFGGIGNHKVVYAPSGIVLPCLGTVGPPGIGAGYVRIFITEGVGKTGIQQFRKFAALFVRKARVPYVGLGIFQVNFLMCHIYVTIKIQIALYPLL